MLESTEIIYSTNRHLRSVIVSPNPKKLCSYYNQYGLDFRKVQIKDKKCFFSYKEPIIILDSGDFGSRQGLSCGLAVCEISSDVTNKQKDWLTADISYIFKNIGDASFVMARLMINQSFYDSLKHSASLTKKEIWIHILRFASINQAKDFYAPLGAWKMEQHNQGLRHYSFVDNANVFELYPLQKHSTGSLEYIILSQASSFSETDPEGRTLRFFKETRSS